MNIIEIIMNATGKPRYEIDKMIIEAAGRIIRYSDDEALRAIVRFNSNTGSLWGAVCMAEAELKRRGFANADEYYKNKA